MKIYLAFIIRQFTIYLAMTIYQTYQERRELLEQRTTAFSVAIVKMCRTHSKDISLGPLLNQVVRSATSIGANYAEANNASSKSDFRNKIFIAKKEAAETRYWLNVLSGLMSDDKLLSLKQEAHELLLIFQQIITTVKMKSVK